MAEQDLKSKAEGRLRDGMAKDSSKPRGIYLVRHGTTKMNGQDGTSDDRARGWEDVPLTDEGRKEAEQAGKDLVNKGVSKIISSDLKRSKETASIVAKELGVPTDSGREWRPWNLGDLQGKQAQQVLNHLQPYVRTNPNRSVPGGESFNDFKKRALPPFQALITKTFNHMDGEGNKAVALVTHSRNVRLYRAWLAKGAPDDFSIDPNVFFEDVIDPGSVSFLDLSGKQLPKDIATIDEGKKKGAE